MAAISNFSSSLEHPTIYHLQKTYLKYVVRSSSIKTHASSGHHSSQRNRVKTNLLVSLACSSECLGDKITPLDVEWRHCGEQQAPTSPIMPTLFLLGEMWLNFEEMSSLYRHVLLPRNTLVLWGKWRKVIYIMCLVRPHGGEKELYGKNLGHHIFSASVNRNVVIVSLWLLIWLPSPPKCPVFHS